MRLVVFVLIAFLLPITAHAQCTNPPAEMGVLIMNKKHKVMQYCNGEVWVGLWGGGGGSSGASHWMKNGSDIYYNSGEVGIGTNDPIYPLDILFSGTAPDGTAGGMRVKNTGPNHAAVIIDSGANSASYIRFQQEGMNKFWMHSTASGQLRFRPEAYPSSDPSVVFMPSGEVGIGTTHPDAKLHVAGDVRVNGIINIANGIFINEGNGAAATASDIRFVDAGVIASDTNLHLNYSGSDNGSSFYIRKGGYTSSAEQVLRINADGNVRIGAGASSYKLRVDGTIYADGTAGALSDIRHKKNIETLESGALSIISSLRPISFDWKTPKDVGMQGRQFGFIAQEVEEIIPEIIFTHNDDGQETKGIRHNDLIAFLVKAAQELKTENDSLRGRIEALEAGRGE